MAKRGKTPSLIGSGAGASKFTVARAQRHCKRCDGSISKGTDCVEVGKPGAMGHKTYCLDCYSEILAQTRQDLNRLETELACSRQHRRGSSQAV